MRRHSATMLLPAGPIVVAAPLEQWFVEMLQEGKLSGFGILADKRWVSPTQWLKDDAVRRAPRLRGTLSDQDLAALLKKWDCVRAGPARCEVGVFPPLAQMRAHRCRR